MTIDRTAVENYLDHQFDGDEGFVVLGIKPEGGTLEQRVFSWPTERADVLTTITQESASGSEVWCPPHVMATPSRSAGNAVSHRRLHADIDESDPNMDLLVELGAWWLYSGRPGHVHAYLELDRDVDLETYNDLARRFAEVLGADHKIRDNDLMRIPGTMNWMHGKNHEPAPVTWATRDHDVTSWSPTDLDTRLPHSSVVSVSKDLEGVFDPEPVDARGVVANPGLHSIITPLLHGESVDRSADTFALILGLAEAGYTRGQALSVLRGIDQVMQRYTGRPEFIYAEINKGFAVKALEMQREAEEDAFFLASIQATDGATSNIWESAGQEAVEACSFNLDELRNPWAPVDIGGILSGTIEEVLPTLMEVPGHCCLLYAGYTHSFHGEPESGKSLLLQIETVRQVMAGNDVLFFDFEADARSVLGRLLLFGASKEALIAHLTYVQPEGVFSLTNPEIVALLGNRYALVVIDGVTAALAGSGLDLNDNSEVTKWHLEFPGKFASATGAAVALIDHVVKSKNDRGRGAIGAQAKLAAVTGAAYLVEPVKPLGKGRRGLISLLLAKDRHGGVNEHSETTDFVRSDRLRKIAQIVVDSTEKILADGELTTDPVVEWQPWEPSDDDEDPEERKKEDWNEKVRIAECLIVDAIETKNREARENGELLPGKSAIEETVLSDPRVSRRPMRVAFERLISGHSVRIVQGPKNTKHLEISEGYTKPGSPKNF